MIDRRIQIPADKKVFVESLLSGEGSSGPFLSKADVMAFAASYGASRGDPLKLEQGGVDPIRQDIFVNRGYESLINLLAIFYTKDPNILTYSEEMEVRRATIFEGYANRGLKLLQNELRGEVELLDPLLLIIENERSTPSRSDGKVDLGSFID